MTAATLQTRTSTQPFKRLDRGYGWGRICETTECGTRLNHFNPGPQCALCEMRSEQEQATQQEDE